MATPFIVTAILFIYENKRRLQYFAHTFHITLCFNLLAPILILLISNRGVFYTQLIRINNFVISRILLIFVSTFRGYKAYLISTIVDESLA